MEFLSPLLRFLQKWLVAVHIIILILIHSGLLQTNNRSTRTARIRECHRPTEKKEEDPSALSADINTDTNGTADPFVTV